MAEQRYAVDWVTPLLRGVSSAAKGIMNIKAEEAKTEQKQIEDAGKFIKSYVDVMSPASAERVLETQALNYGIGGVDIDPSVLRSKQDKDKPFTREQGVAFGLGVGMSNKEALAFGNLWDGQSLPFQNTMKDIKMARYKAELTRATKRMGAYDKTEEKLEKDRTKAEELAWEGFNNYIKNEKTMDEESLNMQLERASSNSKESLDDNLKLVMDKYAIRLLEEGGTFGEDKKPIQTVPDVVKAISSIVPLTAKQKKRLQTAIYLESIKKDKDGTLWGGYGKKSLINKAMLKKVLGSTFSAMASPASAAVSMVYPKGKRTK